MYWKYKPSGGVVGLARKAGYDAGTIYQLRALIPLLIATFPRSI